MTLQLDAPIVAGLLARLRSDLAAAITARNAEADAVADGYLLDAQPVEWITDYVPPLNSVPGFPFVGIRSGPGVFEDDEGYSATGVYDLAVVAMLTNADPQALARQIRRYLAVIARVTLARRVIPHATISGVNAAWGVTLLGVDPGPMIGEIPPSQEPPHGWATYSMLRIRCKTDEDT